MFSKDEVGEEIFRGVESESESENFHHLEWESKSFICLEIILPTPQPWFYSQSKLKKNAIVLLTNSNDWLENRQFFSLAKSN